jgi:hypothetical protein
MKPCGQSRNWWNAAGNGPLGQSRSIKAKDNEAEGNHYLRGLARSAAADYAMLGEKNAAFAALDEAFASRAGVVDINVDPRLDNIRSGPRYAEHLRRIGLPQWSLRS